MEIFVFDQAKSVTSFWFHFKKPLPGRLTYTMKISFDSSQYIRIIEKYAGVSLQSDQLENNILQKDAKNGSMGIIFNILTFYEKHNSSSSSKGIEFVINNVRSVKTAGRSLVIMGEAELFI